MFLQKNFKNFFQNLKKIPPALSILTSLIFCIVLMGGFFFFWRRYAGFFCQTMPTAGIFIFSTVFGITVLLLYFLIRAWSRGFSKRAVLLRRILTGILLLDYLLIGLAIQIPGTSVLTQLVFAIFFLLTVGILYRFEFHHPQPSSEEPEQKSELETDPDSGLMEEPKWESEEIEDEDEPLPPGVQQKLERLQKPNGSEEITGFLRAEFPTGQTKVPLFVSFCPPFPQIPEVECFSLEGTADVEIVQNAPHGVQLSVRKKHRIPMDDSVVLSFRAAFDSPEPLEE